MSPPGAGRAPVLVAVGRDGSDAAVRRGAAVAVRTGRHLLMVHVAAPGPYGERLGHDALALARARARALVAADHIETRMPLGDVVGELAAAAAGCALLVNERRAPGTGLRPSLSVTASLAAASDVPLLSVPAGWVEGTDPGVVTAGIDLAQPQEVALRGAVVAAMLRHATLRVISVTWRPTRSPGLGLVDGPSEQTLRDAVLHRVADAGGDECDVAVEIVGGRPEVSLVQASASSALLVLGRHRPWLETGSRLGPVARAVLREASCPVLFTAPEVVHVRSTPPAPHTAPPRTPPRTSRTTG